MYTLLAALHPIVRLIYLRVSPPCLWLIFFGPLQPNGGFKQKNAEHSIFLRFLLALEGRNGMIKRLHTTDIRSGAVTCANSPFTLSRTAEYEARKVELSAWVAKRLTAIQSLFSTDGRIFRLVTYMADDLNRWFFFIFCFCFVLSIFHFLVSFVIVLVAHVTFLLSHPSNLRMQAG
jgi:hypothetical protein